MPAYARLSTPRSTSVYARLDGPSARLLTAAPWLGGTETGESEPVAGATILAPLVPGKIVCVGRNYSAHAAELGNALPTEPLLFFKPTSSLVGPGDAVLLPPQSERVDYEAELGVVIGKRGRHVRVEDALGMVFGYTCVNDITARDLQKKDGQWARAKGFDSFCPTGPAIVTDLDPTALRVVGRVNGQVRQDALTSTMIFSVATLIAYITSVMTLEPGDLLVTGTPEGVGPLAPGDQTEVEIEGIGLLRNPVQKG
jgi:2-keto-4-pentenoate hydratase/2-oxohepta-3-ene-1,7-dioic acid hydratase in catechol pathway